MEEESHELEERKEKVKVFMKKANIIVIIVLIALILFAFWIRTRNIDNLKDFEGNPILGPDLDPYIFLRYAENIVENGKLMEHDSMRSVPLGFDTGQETVLLPYMMAYFHKFYSIFKDVSVTQSAIMFPAYFFALTVLIFFLFVRKVFDGNKRKDIIATISTLFFIVTPSLIPRTIAGIPEKESVGFFFLFLAFYFFIYAWKSEKWKGVIFGILAGIATALMGLVWGGVIFAFMTISLASFIGFIFLKENKLVAYGSWLISATILTLLSSVKYNLISWVTSTSTSFSIAVFVIMLFYFIFTKVNLFEFEIIKSIKKKIKINDKIISVLISAIVLLIIVLIFFGPGFITKQVKEIIEHLIHPFVQNRFIITVAENRQPFFDEWRASFGPVIQNIPVFFWLFFVGSIVLFYDMFKEIGKKKWVLLLSYIIFLFGLIFSRYSGSSVLNGISLTSKIVYFGSMLTFLAIAAYIYFKDEEKLHNINFSYLVVFTFFVISIVAARGGVRLVMVLASIVPVMVAYLIVTIVERIIKSKDDLSKTIAIAIAVVLIVSSAYTMYVYYKSAKSTAENFVPLSTYNIQWQKAMKWVRENTDKNAVFAHWWDYGYWVQSLGKRATIVDGGNFIVYWNHLMGRLVLTGDNEKDALEFLYTHNATHLLIDSSDIGKYPAYSSIGSGVEYDRYSWISFFGLDESNIRESKNETIYFYQGGTMMDEDFTYNNEFFPKEQTGVGAIVLRIGSDGEIKQPTAIFVKQGKQIEIPLRYLYLNKSYDFKIGYEGTFYIVPRIIQSGQNIRISDKGIGMFLTERVSRGLMAKLYLLDGDENFELMKTEENPIIENIRQQGMNIGSFAFFNEILGPIKIWKIKYPKDIRANEDYLKTEYPDVRLTISK